MRWRGSRQSENIEDRRGVGIPTGVRIGGGGGLGILLLALVAMFFGINPLALLEVEQPSTSVETRPERSGSGRDELRDFVSVVLADNHRSSIFTGPREPPWLNMNIGYCRLTLGIRLRNTARSEPA
jgi:predicted metalloprotease